MGTENLVLEEKQLEAYNDLVGQYEFVCEGAGVVSHKSSLLKTKKNGIRLHFLRLGVFKKEEETTLVAPPNVEGEPQVLGGVVVHDVLSESENFYPAPTSLNYGYIYIFNDQDADLWYEYEVDEFGMFSPVYWKDNKGEDGKYLDIRKASGAKEKDKVFPEDTILWIAYSPVQWSIAHHTTMRTDQNEREKRMVKVTCSGFVKDGSDGQSLADIRPYREVYGEFRKDQQVASCALQDKLEQIHAQETQEDANGDNDLYEDMFITLADPIGCVDDIAEYVELSFLEMEAMIEALQTGQDHQSVYERLVNEGEKESFSEEEEQIKALFHLALTTYQLVYNDPKMIKDYDGGGIGYWNTDFKGSGIHKDKIVSVLGVVERKELRRKIASYRDDLGYLMCSDYYKDAWIDYHSDNDDFVLEGKYRLTSHMALLARSPHDLDRHLDLKSDYEGITNLWEGFFADTLDLLDQDKPINVLLDTPVEIALLTGSLIDLENKLGGVIRQLIESYASLQVEKREVVTRSKTEIVTKTRKVNIVKTRTESSFKTITVSDYYDVVVNRLRKHTVYGVEVIDLEPRKLEALLAPLAYQLDETKIVTNRANNKPLYNPRDANKPKVARYQLTDELVLKKQLRGKNLVQVPITKEEIITETKVVQFLNEIEQKYKVPVTKNYQETTTRSVSKYANAELAQKIFDGKIFTGSLALLQVFNVMNAYNSIGSKSDFKGITNAVGISAELLEASMHYRRSLLLAKGVSAESFMASRSGRLMKFAGKTGAGITVLMCGWESLTSAHARDYDAMWAWTGAGAAWGTFLFAGGGLGFTPPGLIVAGVALGLTALGYYLKDTPLEALFKNNVLSDAVGLEMNAGEKPWEYSKRLYQNRDSLIEEPISEFFVKDEFRKWTNFKVAYQDFLDVLVCANIHFTPTKLIKSKTIKPWTSTHSVDITTSDIVAYKAEINFRQFLTYTDQLEYEVYYFENWETQQYKKIALKNEKITIERKKGEIPKAIVEFNVSPNDLTNNSTNAHIVFVCRISLENQKYYPIDIHEELRFIGAKFTTQEKVTNVGRGIFMKKTIKSSDYQAPVKIDTLKKLLSKEAWKRN